MSKHLWDAIAVNISTGKVRIFGAAITRENAEAISKMAVMRRGVDAEYFMEVPSGTYKAGDVRNFQAEALT